MITENLNGLTKLCAEENKKITNSERTFFSDFIYLGVNDSVNNYEEVGREIWKHFIKEDNPDIIELTKRTDDLQTDVENLQETSETLNESQLMTEETVNIVMEAVTDSDEKHESLTDVVLLALDEMYQMLEPLQGLSTLSRSTKAKVAAQSVTTKSNTKEGYVMVQLYAVMVQRGLKTIEQVPVRYRDQVKALLEAVED